MKIGLLLLLAYFLGSIPFGYLICKYFYKVDIRELGSGNIGATNVVRSVGKIPGALVLALDVAKGFLPVFLAVPLGPRVAIICAAAAILGHSRSIFLKFKGGKSVATGLGTLLGLAPMVGGVLFFFWLLVLLIGRFVSLASVTAAILLPCLMFLFRQPWEFILFGAMAGLYVVFRHRANLVRLFEGKEPKIGSHAS
ncbi:MAG TPA: acyl-phosphate glycerol 3-phosphate acyltransferase [Cyanobacteria bacterium UBA8530]|nr:acyl-phosphate glycerol 3-phosphate acyltransferase [Cyanobacteria bacterium UBA8530]